MRVVTRGIESTAGVVVFGERRGLVEEDEAFSESAPFFPSTSKFAIFSHLDSSLPFACALRFLPFAESSVSSPAQTSPSSGSGSEASGCSCAVVIVGEDEDEELPIDVVEKYAEVGVMRDGVEATVAVCVWIISLIAGSWVGECGRRRGRW
ncbi:uncharacterized protein LACBIDRAFT_313488 [Laccaria bicolor S238N-H82]|uniref:Predicted protein n=1 Tax=Laccaria bicolor (strain S238N-H82 / ATCC MYA-4686) TaxID=486041 RepID=B0D045_LACBS|nr:uncharacterized protein LACBIDRAFT_313488 [Laccaria bicolor S238N-H82]EDR11765.1 predicted protein [Laccaria bicolor S238N-H82]|eukprot:XP_001877662.1 predicted protein [Laccaria bicolor S238N-H82]